jgi:hypothetical protein
VDQGVSATFKACYLQPVIRQFVSESDDKNQANSTKIVEYIQYKKKPDSINLAKNRSKIRFVHRKSGCQRLFTVSLALTKPWKVFRKTFRLDSNKLIKQYSERIKILKRRNYRKKKSFNSLRMKMLKGLTENENCN